MNLIIILVAVAIVLVVARMRGGNLPAPAERRQRVVDEFSRRKLRQWLLGIPIGVVVIALMWARRHPEYDLMTLLAPAAVVVVMGSSIFTYHNWRCPACGAWLGKYAWMQGCCPQCHTSLR